jgi:hypothetical protein
MIKQMILAHINWRFEEYPNPEFDIVQFKSRADNKFGEFILPLRISNSKTYSGKRAPFHKSFKAQKSTSMLIGWQIINIRLTQTTQIIWYKSLLLTFNLV